MRTRRSVDAGHGDALFETAVEQFEAEQTDKTLDESSPAKRSKPAAR